MTLEQIKKNIDPKQTNNQNLPKTKKKTEKTTAEQYEEITEEKFVAKEQ